MILSTQEALGFIYIISSMISAFIILTDPGSWRWARRESKNIYVVTFITILLSPIFLLFIIHDRIQSFQREMRKKP
jgi:MFS family permease